MLIPGMNELPSTGRVAGIDFGTVRIGIAVSDPGRLIATPIENYTRLGIDADARRFRRLVEEEEIVLFVVGLPIHLSGDASAMSIEARQFGQWITETTGMPVVYHDERLTSFEAEEILLSAELSSKKRKKRLDMLAAQRILSGWIDSQREPTSDQSKED